MTLVPRMRRTFASSLLLRGGGYSRDILVEGVDNFHHIFYFKQLIFDLLLVVPFGLMISLSWHVIIKVPPAISV